MGELDWYGIFWESGLLVLCLSSKIYMFKGSRTDFLYTAA